MYLLRVFIIVIVFLCIVGVTLTAADENTTLGTQEAETIGNISTETFAPTIHGVQGSTEKQTDPAAILLLNAFTSKTPIEDLGNPTSSNAVTETSSIITDTGSNYSSVELSKNELTTPTSKSTRLTTTGKNEVEETSTGDSFDIEESNSNAPTVCETTYNGDIETTFLPSDTTISGAISTQKVQGSSSVPTEPVSAKEVTTTTNVTSENKTDVSVTSSESMSTKPSTTETTTSLTKQEKQESSSLSTPLPTLTEQFKTVKMISTSLQETTSTTLASTTVATTTAEEVKTSTTEVPITETTLNLFTILKTSQKPLTNITEPLTETSTTTENTTPSIEPSSSSSATGPASTEKSELVNIVRLPESKSSSPIQEALAKSSTRNFESSTRVAPVMETTFKIYTTSETSQKPATSTTNPVTEASSSSEAILSSRSPTIPLPEKLTDYTDPTKSADVFETSTSEQEAAAFAWWILAPIIFGALVLVGIVICLYLCCKKRKMKDKEKTIMIMVEEGTPPKTMNSLISEAVDSRLRSVYDDPNRNHENNNTTDKTGLPPANSNTSPLQKISKSQTKTLTNPPARSLKSNQKPKTLLDLDPPAVSPSKAGSRSLKNRPRTLLDNNARSGKSKSRRRRSSRSKVVPLSVIETTVDGNSLMPQQLQAEPMNLEKLVPIMKNSNVNNQK